MPNFQIKAEKQPTRCEICHQADQFDPKTSTCRRCLENVVVINVPTRPVVGSILPLTRTERGWLVVGGFVVGDSLMTLILPFRGGVITTAVCQFFGLTGVVEINALTPSDCGMFGIFREYPIFFNHITLSLFLIWCLAFFIEQAAGKSPTRLFVYPPIKDLIFSQSFRLKLWKYWYPKFAVFALGILINLVVFSGFVLPKYTLADAVRNDYQFLAKALRAKGNSIDQVDHHQWTPLMYACANGDLAMVHDLLDHGANVNAQSIEGQTPLMCAVIPGYAEITELLLQRGAHINHQDEWGRSALMHALEKYRSNIGHFRLDPDNTRALQNGVGSSIDQTIQVLLAYIPDLVGPKDVGGQTIAMKAASSGNTEILTLARSQISWELDEKDHSGKTVLMYAVEGNNPEVVREVLSYQHNIDAQDNFGMTALMYALSNEHQHALIFFEMLIEAGANIHVKDSMGHTALVYAIQNKQLEVTRWLIEVESDLNLQSKIDLSLVGLIQAHFSRKQADELVSLINQKQQAVTSQSAPSRK
ncbi:MAG TPA: ankyrin repeat domain-containing protein [Acidobacteriota bacterium]|nr:ankyrin repeat domain-containing protein [Acidobacteriota bacterium]